MLMSDLPIDTIMLATGTVTADRAKMLASGKRVVRRIGCGCFVLSTRRRTQKVAVTTSGEGSYMQRRE